MGCALSNVAASSETLARSRLVSLDRSPPQLRWVETTASTNSDLLAGGLPPPEGAALVAEQQSAGRGRLGRRWQALPGASLCLSLALRSPGGAASLAGASLVAGAAVARTLRALGALDVGLKWPNDLWAHERKLGGLLLELGGHGDRTFVVVGVGLNLSLPEEFSPGQAWIDLSRLGLRVDRVELACALVLALRRQLLRLQSEGLQALLPDWHALDCLQDRRVRMCAGEEVREGVAIGIANDGGLRVRHADGERVWYSGEASLRPA
jgi:BirA family biotin operon repressor/biotin-[acetyl-CoA-carboxylase] ligase